MRSSIRALSCGAAFVAAIGALVMSAAPASASVTIALDLRQLVRRSHVIFLGTVVRQDTHWDDRRRIVTDVTFSIEDAVKGSSRRGEEIVVRRLGGAIGDLGMRIEGEPSWNDGERSVVFAYRPTGRPMLRPVGMSQGVLPVRIQAGRELVFPGGAGLALMQRVDTGQLLPAPPALIHTRPLADVLTDIRQVVEETRVAP